jgi:hypothetical protein
MGGERSGTQDSDSGQAGQDLPLGRVEQDRDLVLERGDVQLQPLVTVQVPGQPPGSLFGVCRWREAATPPLNPVLGGRLGEPARRPGDQ